jgi:D-alanine-D-alanine ligase
MPPREGERHLLHVEGRAPLAFDVVFPVMHGPFGEDGCLQGLLELAAAPYVGSGVAASAVGMDKLLQKRVFAQADLPLVPWTSFDRAAYRANADACLASATALGFPSFVKPANMGSSLGVSKVKRREELQDAIELALELDTMVLVEEGLDAPREIEFAILGNDTPEVSEAGEIVVEHADGWYSFDAKYLDPSGARLSVPAALRPAERASLQLLALQAYRVLGCAGLARVDLFVSGGEAFVNEVNTLPGFTAISMYPRLWKEGGLEGRALVSRLIDLALERFAVRSALRTSR